MKVVINDKHGSFCLSEEAIFLYKEKNAGLLRDNYDPLFRKDPILIEIVEQLGKKADGKLASLKIVEIPDDVEFHISEYYGKEWIAENHRTWNQ
jgi:hypothetical protein